MAKKILSILPPWINEVREEGFTFEHKNARFRRWSEFLGVPLDPETSDLDFYGAMTWRLLERLDPVAFATPKKRGRKKKPRHHRELLAAYAAAGGDPQVGGLSKGQADHISEHAPAFATEQEDNLRILLGEAIKWNKRRLDRRRAVTMPGLPNLAGELPGRFDLTAKLGQQAAAAAAFLGAPMPSFLDVKPPAAEAAPPSQKPARRKSPPKRP